MFNYITLNQRRQELTAELAKINSDIEILQKTCRHQKFQVAEVTKKYIIEKCTNCGTDKFINRRLTQFATMHNQPCYCDQCMKGEKE